MRECKHWWFDHWDSLANYALGVVGTPKIRLQPGEIAVDPHVHTMFSHCSITQPDRLIRWAVKIGLNAICVMDHNDTSGSEDTERCADHLKEQGVIPEDFLVIPGLEINSDTGHIGAMFIREKIDIALTPADTVQAIHDLGGLAVAVHPYHSTGIRDCVFEVPFDAVEVECGAVFGSDLVFRNRALADDPRLEGSTKLGASDAHYFKALGSCYTILRPDECTLDGIRRAITAGCARPVTSEPCRKIRSLLGGIPKLK